MIIYDNFFDEVLLEPIKEGADDLKIISGYASSAMAFHHLEKIRTTQNTQLNISLLVGMCPLDGISLSNHQGFNKIQNEDYRENFTCNYIYEYPQVHSKLYIWSKNNQFYKSFVGSANYTQNAFYGKQQEILEVSQDASVLGYFSQLESRSIICNHQEIENYIKVFSQKNYKQTPQDSQAVGIIDQTVEQVNVPLYSVKQGEKYVPERSGLNWGQRPEAKREPNQAYIQLRPSVYKSDFFPIRPQHFTVITDDNCTLICTRAQKSTEGQAVHTPQNNSLLGEYFRRRLKVASGAKVVMADLEKYGRDEVTFYKIDDEHFYMDFSNSTA